MTSPATYSISQATTRRSSSSSIGPSPTISSARRIVRSSKLTGQSQNLWPRSRGNSKQASKQGPMNKGPVTLLDVAKVAGVSLATASRVINGSDRRVSGPLREQVMAAARQLHYVRNANAQALARSRSSIVGVIVHDLGGPFFSNILHGIEGVAEAAGRSLLICNSHRDPAREVEYVTLMQAHRASALIMTGSGLHDVDYNEQMLDAITGFTHSGGRVVM